MVSGFGVVALAGEAEWAVNGSAVCCGCGAPDGGLGVPVGVAVWVDQVGWGSDKVADGGVEAVVDFGLGCAGQPGSVGLGYWGEGVWPIVPGGGLDSAVRPPVVGFDEAGAVPGEVDAFDDPTVGTMPVLADSAARGS